VTARVERRCGRRVRRFQRMSALMALAAVGGLILMGVPGHARADQVSGTGDTGSAITVPWTQGLLDSSNQPITSAAAGELAPNSDRGSTAPTGSLSFMYNDFKNLKVTVSQTQDITHQGVTVSWTGGEQTTALTSPTGNFLELMECYGDSDSGPDPADCEWGSPGVMSSVPNASVDARYGDLCVPGSVPSASSPPGSADGSSAANGCDPEEPTTASPSHIAPCTGSTCSTGPPQNYTVPFIPVSDTAAPAYETNDLSQWYNETNSNEVPVATTAADGTGQVQFETLTGTEAPGLGCGEPEADGSARGCWLVIVPRGQYEPNGYQIHGFTGNGAYIVSSPLSASNWAQRIQIHLAFAPTQVFCPIGTQETETVGTVLATRAVSSWQLALNQQADCKTIYGFSAVPEATSTQQLASSGNGSTAGLAFTTIPIGSEATRDSSGGTSTVTLPQLLYAPVAVSAVAIGFNINNASGQYIPAVKLSPQVLARALTQAYRSDLPDYYHYVAGFDGPSWSLTNPLNISYDLQFQALNPGVAPDATSAPLAPLLTEDHSELNQQIWQWIQADPAASTWLDGTAADGVTPDPDYTALKLGAAPAIDSFPRAYTGCLDLGTDPGPPPKEETKCSLDLLPYVNNYDSAAGTILAAIDPTTTEWDDTATAPDGSGGWWDSVGREPLGNIFMWGISDTADLAAFGLTAADLCNDSGSNCVAPTVASVTAALDSTTPDSTGLLEVNPAKTAAGAYPLVDVTYAAVATDQSAAALNAYASLISFAAGTGQTPGVAPGDLPPGYLPLPASLQAQAQTVVAKLRALANGSASGGQGGQGGQTTQSQQPTGVLKTVSGGPTAASGSASAPAGTTTHGPDISGPAALLAASTTPPQPVGPIRWVLLAVAIAGGVSAAVGTVLRAARVPRWLERVRS
jgi:hypothetical protein